MKHSYRTLYFPGAGANVFWQLGVVKALLKDKNVRTCETKDTDMDSLRVYGVSAGAISAVFYLCNIDVDDAIRQAFDLSDTYDLSTRTFGVIGIWGYLVRIWLDSILPENCANVCNHRCTLCLQPVAPLWSIPPPPVLISSFRDKEDLIDCILASCHLPLLLDLAPFATFRNKWYMDGQIFKDPFDAVRQNAKDNKHLSMIFRYEDDKDYMAYVNGLHFLQYRDKAIAERMTCYGVEYVQMQ